MKRFWPLILGGVLLAAGLGWWVLQVTALAPQDRGNAASYGQFVLAAVGLLISLIALWKTFAPAPVAPNLDELTDQLAIAMRNQWTAAAMDRPPELQPGALRALSEQATYRLVVLTRTADLAEVAKQQTLTGAVALELQPLAQADVANYLLHPLTDPAPPAWRTLTSTLTDQPGSAIAEALATPLAVSLVRDTYLPADPVDELCNTERFAGAGQITNHLLDRAIIAAYTPRPGQLQPRYTPETAHRTLCFIASRLAIRRTRDIVWWDIPTWVPLRLRALISTVTTVAITGLVGLVGGAVLYDEMNNLVVGTIVFLLGFGLSCGLWSGLTLGAPWQIDLAKWRRPGGIRLPIKAVIRMTPGVLLFGLAIGFASWFTLGIFDAFKFGNLVIAIAFGLAVGFLGGIMGATMMAEASNTDIADPVLVWRRDGQFWITGIIVAWVAAGSFASFLAGPRLGFAFGLMFAFAFGSGIGPLMSEAWRTAISQACLTIRYRTPLRLIRFLEDARSRHLLRTVGPIYQFRHATLQDRLAEAPSSRGR